MHGGGSGAGCRARAAATLPEQGLGLSESKMFHARRRRQIGWGLQAQHATLCSCMCWLQADRSATRALIRAGAASHSDGRPQTSRRYHSAVLRPPPMDEHEDGENAGRWTSGVRGWGTRNNGSSSCCSYRAPLSTAHRCPLLSAAVRCRHGALRKTPERASSNQPASDGCSSAPGCATDAAMLWCSGWVVPAGVLGGRRVPRSVFLDVSCQMQQKEKRHHDPRRRTTPGPRRSHWLARVGTVGVPCCVCSLHRRSGLVPSLQSSSTALMLRSAGCDFSNPALARPSTPHPLTSPLALPPPHPPIRHPSQRSEH